jgi:hypothetical protein
VLTLEKEEPTTPHNLPVLSFCGGEGVWGSSMCWDGVCVGLQHVLGRGVCGAPACVGLRVCGAPACVGLRVCGAPACVGLRVCGAPACVGLRVCGAPACVGLQHVGLDCCSSPDLFCHVFFIRCILGCLYWVLVGCIPGCL